MLKGQTNFKGSLTAHSGVTDIAIQNTIEDHFQFQRKDIGSALHAESNLSKLTENQWIDATPAWKPPAKK